MMNYKIEKCVDMPSVMYSSLTPFGLARSLIAFGRSLRRKRGPVLRIDEYPISI